MLLTVDISIDCYISSPNTIVFYKTNILIRHMALKKRNTGIKTPKLTIVRNSDGQAGRDNSLKTKSMKMLRGSMKTSLKNWR